MRLGWQRVIPRLTPGQASDVPRYVGHGNDALGRENPGPGKDVPGQGKDVPGPEKNIPGQGNDDPGVVLNLRRRHSMNA